MCDTNELYKLAKFVLKNWNVEYDEDLVQELVLQGFISLNKFDESKSCKTTYLVNVMQNKLMMLNRSKKHKGRDAQLLSLDQTTEDGVEFSNLFPDDIDIADLVNKKNIVEQIAPLIKTPLKMRLNGATQQEIAIKYKVSQELIRHRIAANISEIRQFVKERGLEL